MTAQRVVESLASLVIVLSLGCAHAEKPIDLTPLKVTILPPQLDFERVLPPAAPEKVDAPQDSARFEDIPVLGGKLCDKANNCKELPAGILLSEESYVKIIADKATLKRVKIELSVVKNLRSEEHKLIRLAETAYQNNIVDLQKENVELRRPKFWNEFKPILGFVLGVSMSAATVYGINKAAK